MADMSKILTTPVLLHGIGSGVLQTVTGKVLELTTAQDMEINVQASTEDVYGGDGLFPLYTYITKKEGTIKITSADFKLSQIGVAQGTENHVSGQKRMYNFLVTKDDTQLGSGLSLTGVEVVAIIAPDGKNGKDGLNISPTGGVTAGSAAAEGEYSVWVKADDTKAVGAEMLKNAMPEVAAFNWMFKTEDSEGHHYQVDIYARRVRADGSFTMSTGRDKATAPELTVKILDPGNGRDDFAVITITKLD